MTTRPLTYGSLKVVLEHMEANTRILLAVHSPSIRTAENVAPIRINDLSFQQRSLKINKIEYKLGVHRVCAAGELWELYKEDNRSGGIGHDLDQYGLPDWSIETTLLPSDIQIEPRSEGRDVDRANLIFMYGNALRHNLEALGAEMDELQKKNVIKNINFLQESILPYRLAEDNALSPYKMFIQLTVHDTVTARKIERVDPSSKKLPDAFKYLMTKIFGGRQGEIYVKKIHSLKKELILRVPENLKLIVTELFLESPDRLDMLSLSLSTN
ncbi:hypothetical protein CRE_10401 [Caenorhabditis remanei]|uniref:Uncharacterized protein n=1 Tax=Caenorhabditis remanei TaxID=31234 RepID=E3MQK8_CAERE|nr:hypothetical protein CRE_10401 [Caenorhabditis remanei]